MKIVRETRHTLSTASENKKPQKPYQTLLQGAGRDTFWWQREVFSLSFHMLRVYITCVLCNPRAGEATGPLCRWEKVGTAVWHLFYQGRPSSDKFALMDSNTPSIFICGVIGKLIWWDSKQSDWLLWLQHYINECNNKSLTDTRCLRQILDANPLNLYVINCDPRYKLLEYSPHTPICYSWHKLI